MFEYYAKNCAETGKLGLVDVDMGYPYGVSIWSAHSVSLMNLLDVGPCKFKFGPY